MKKTLLKLVVFLCVLCGLAAGGWYILFAERTLSQDEAKSISLSLLSQPAFSGDEFQSQLLGAARLEMYYPQKGKIAFSVLQENMDDLKLFLRDPNAIQDATFAFDGRTMFFAKVENFTVNPETSFSFAYENATFIISLTELSNSCRNFGVYGGSLYAKTGRRSIMVNHGAFVATPGNAPIRRFATQLTQGKTTREEKVQAVLDFVINEIEYNEGETAKQYETMKRPVEVLMVRNGDCSNKTNLCASFLNQLGEDVLLVYFDGHIGVMLPEGSFSNVNGHGIQYDGITWVYLECTARGYIIGESDLGDQLGEIRYLHRVVERNRILDVTTGRPLQFE